MQSELATFLTISLVVSVALGVGHLTGVEGNRAIRQVVPDRPSESGLVPDSNGDFFNWMELWLDRSEGEGVQQSEVCPQRDNLGSVSPPGDCPREADPTGTEPNQTN